MLDLEYCQLLFIFLQLVFVFATVQKLTETNEEKDTIIYQADENKQKQQQQLLERIQYDQKSQLGQGVINNKNKCNEEEEQQQQEQDIDFNKKNNPTINKTFPLKKFNISQQALEGSIIDSQRLEQPLITPIFVTERNRYQQQEESKIEQKNGQQNQIIKQFNAKNRKQQYLTNQGQLIDNRQKIVFKDNQHKNQGLSEQFLILRQSEEEQQYNHEKIKASSWLKQKQYDNNNNRRCSQNQQENDKLNKKVDKYQQEINELNRKRHKVVIEHVDADYDDDMDEEGEGERLGRGSQYSVNKVYTVIKKRKEDEEEQINEERRENLKKNQQSLSAKQQQQQQQQQQKQFQFKEELFNLKKQQDICSWKWFRNREVQDNKYQEELEYNNKSLLNGKKAQQLIVLETQGTQNREIRTFDNIESKESQSINNKKEGIAVISKQSEVAQHEGYYNTGLNVNRKLEIQIKNQEIEEKELDEQKKLLCYDQLEAQSEQKEEEIKQITESKEDKSLGVDQQDKINNGSKDKDQNRQVSEQREVIQDALDSNQSKTVVPSSKLNYQSNYQIKSRIKFLDIGSV